MDVERWRRLAARHRRALAAGAAAVAVLTGLSALRPPGPVGRDVVVAARDLPAGHLLGADDVTLRSLPVDAAPAGALASADPLLDRVLVSPVQAGEPLTPTRVSGPEALGVQVRSAGTGLVAVPVRVADEATVTLLRPGDLVDVWAARATAALDAATDVGTGSAPDTVTGSGVATGSAQGGDPVRARRVASAARVLAVPRAAGGGLLDGGDRSAASGIVVLAVPPSAAGALAAAAARDRVSVAVLPAG